VTREDVLSKPGTAPGETILVGHNESAEEFQWDEEAQRWIRTFPEVPLFKSKQLGKPKAKNPPPKSRSPSLPTRSFGSRYVCPDDGRSAAAEDGIQKYGLLAMQDRFMHNLRTENTH